jgi:phosphotransferase system  glucose/maltose/N-acetylglucosamine-specific IIC component
MTSLNTSVLGGVIIGLVTAYLYNRFKTIQLPKALGFFSGVRFIPIVSVCCAMLLGILFSAV